MKRFHKKVDLRNRKAMAAFLEDHTRYYTINSESGVTSYANCVKLYRLRLPRRIQDRAYAMLGVEEVFKNVRTVMQEWGASHDWKWQAHFNGPNKGHIVLYRGGVDYHQARTAQCDRCGQLTWHKKETPCTADGCDGTLKMLSKPRPEVVTFRGVGVDEAVDFADWSMSKLQDRVLLIQDFDLLCDRILGLFLSYCENYRVVERQVMVAEMVKCLEPVSEKR